MNNGLVDSQPVTVTDTQCTGKGNIQYLKVKLK